MTGDTVLAKLATWGAGLSVDHLDDDVVSGATRSIVDSLGVGLAGARRQLTRSVAATVGAEVAAGPCRVLGGASQLRPTGAALINGTACHVLDFDDTCYDGIVHASCVVLPAVLACAEDIDSNGADMLAGFVVGSEITYVLGRALPGIFWRGWWTTSLLGSIGAAAGCARILNLDANQTTHAMALASCFTFGLRTLLGTDATPLGAGYAAEAGVRAALLARAGVQGPRATFESPLGLAAMCNEGKIDQAALSSLGEQYALRGENLSFKAYPACSGTQAAAQAAGELLDEHSVVPDAVRSVQVRVMPLVAENLRYPSPQNLTQAQFSMPFAIGCHLRFGRFGVAQLFDGVLQDAAFQTEMAKVEMIRDEHIVAEAERANCPEAALVTVELKDGTTFHRFVGAARGMPSAPLSDEMLDTKFIDCASGELGDERSRALLAQLRDLSTLASTRSLWMTAA